MNRFLRWLLPDHGTVISKEEAVEVARKECERRGIPWLEPVKVFRHYGNWSVWTHANHRGGNVRVIVDKETGEIYNIAGPIIR